MGQRKSHRVKRGWRLPREEARKKICMWGDYCCNLDMDFPPRSFLMGGQISRSQIIEGWLPDGALGTLSTLVLLTFQMQWVEQAFLIICVSHDALGCLRSTHQDRVTVTGDKSLLLLRQYRRHFVQWQETESHLSISAMSSSLPSAYKFLRSFKWQCEHVGKWFACTLP